MVDQNEMNRIALIAVYFGKLPVWINFFIETCKYNPTIDWIIFIDDVFPDNIARNVRFIKTTMDDISQLFSEILELNIIIKRPYKLCDFRPAYGLCFGEYLKDYDFWGHIDLDVLYGDIREFITKNILKTKDIISADSRRICGPFSLYKNCNDINNLFKKNPEFTSIFLSNKHEAFDEIGFDETVKGLVNEGKIKCLFGHFQRYGKKRIPSYWYNGKIIVKSTKAETMFLHLRPFKKYIRPPSFEYNQAPFGWKITKKGFQVINNIKGFPHKYLAT